jgi:MFS family permease
MIVLDATIVNVALPQMQQALGFSGTGLEWIVTAYSLAFGSLLLLGGRLGDIFGRRKIFIAGVLIFSLGSLAGGFANSRWLPGAAFQGPAPLAAPTALALIATTFPGEAPPGSRRVAAGGAGRHRAAPRRVLTSYVSWRWCSYNAHRRGRLPRRPPGASLLRRLDIPGRHELPGWPVVWPDHAAAAGGVSHWGSPPSLAGGRLGARGFFFIERRGSAELPLHLHASRSGAYVMMLLIATALFAVFFFLTIYIQTVWGYSPIRAGIAWLPFPLADRHPWSLGCPCSSSGVGVRPMSWRS